MNQPESEVTDRLRLEALEQEMEALRQKLGGQPAPAASVSEPAQQEGPPGAQEAPAPLVPNSPAQISKAEGLIRQARLARQRGQAAQASEYLKQAESAAPNSPAVLEFIGDELVERKMFKNAAEVYKKALALDPKNVVIETKHARAVLGSDSYVNPSLLSEFDVMASGKIATLLSAVIPGLGQIVSGEFWKGLFIFILWASMLAWIGPNGIYGILVAVGIKKGSASEFRAIVLVPIFIAFVLWVVAMMDAKFGAGMATPRKIEHPKPPEDLPFE